MDEYFRKLLVTGVQTDVTILVNGKQFHAHRSIVGAHSAYLETLLSACDVVNLPYLSSNAFGTLLDYMYVQTLKINYNNVYDLLHAANILQMTTVIALCNNFLLRANNLLRHLISEGINPERIVDGNRNGIVIPIPTKTIGTETGKDRTENNEFTDGGDVKFTRDVASCDGPVRFHKIPNEDYDKGKLDDELTNGKNEDGTARDTDRNKTSNDAEGSHKSDEVYYCVYCSASFKSHYCYQKHKKRHINPIFGDITATGTKDGARNEASGNKRNKTNVPFYPCKACGAKFPSYYFVNKHKKECPVSK
ncbi:Uncharacterised protein r2_g2918 [Pycnogonum litorale]